MAPRLAIDADHVRRVNLAMHLAGVPLVREVQVTNAGDADARGVVVTGRVALGTLTDDGAAMNGTPDPSGSIESSGGAWTSRVELIRSGETYRLAAEDLRIDRAYLAGRTETETATVLLTAQAEGPAGDGEGIVARRLAVELLPFDHFAGVGVHPEFAAAFVTPNHPALTPLLRAARERLGAISGDDALDGYQSRSRTRAALMSRACFEAACALDLGYINPPASFETTGQRVRLAGRLLRERLGGCLDLSLLLCGLWEQCGLHPLVVFMENHAFPAVWTHDGQGATSLIDDVARLRNLIELGEIVPVESTLLARARSGASFDDAVASARERLRAATGHVLGVDIAGARRRGVRPLPLVVRDEDGAPAPDEPDLTSPALPGSRATGESLAPVVLADSLEGAEPGASAPPTGTPEAGTPAGRVQRWRTRLLDLTLHNRFVNFRESARNLRLLVPDASKLEDLLASEKRVTVLARDERRGTTERPEEVANFLSAELANGRVYADHPPNDAAKRLLTMFRDARTALEETGSSPLHLAIGMLRWYETGRAESPRLAPIILIPVTLTRTSLAGGYRYDMALEGEPARPNITLLEKLRRDFALDTSGLDGFEDDEAGIDVAQILRRYRSAIRDVARWEVEESAWLGMFSFSRFLMWRDLGDNAANLRKSRLVGRLIDPEAPLQEDGGAEPEFPRPEALDDELAPGDVLCTREADASQLAAVRAASTGRTFVLEGPPGTGKSQTIANIIADSMARGRRVLFVAEKLAALSVVRSRLEQDGLGAFCLELHSTKSSKRAVLEQLRQALESPPPAGAGSFDELCAGVGQTRAALNAFVKALHHERESGETLHEVLGRLASLGEGERPGGERLEGEKLRGESLAPEYAGDPAGTTRQQLATWRTRVRDLSEAGAAVDPPGAHALRGVGATAWSFTLPERARAALSASKDALSRYGLRAAELIRLLGTEPKSLTIGLLSALTSASELLAACPVLSDKLVWSEGARKSREELRGAVRGGRERDALERRLAERWKASWLSVDATALLTKVEALLRQPAILRLITSLGLRKQLREHATGRLPPLSVIADDLRSVLELKRLNSLVQASMAGGELLGERWNGGRANWDDIEQVLNWADGFALALSEARQFADESQVTALASAASIQELPPRIAPVARDLIRLRDAHAQAWRAMDELLAVDPRAAFGCESERAPIADVDATLARWLGALEDLQEWCAWRRARDAAIADGLRELVSRYERGGLAREHLQHAFERGHARRWFAAVADGDDSVRAFSAATHERTIDRFRELDAQMIAAARREVASRVRASLPGGSGAPAPGSELGVLRHQLQLQRRHLPVRRLIEKLPTLLPRLKPCFLMSPLSVAQYLDPSRDAFDLVVFDEASQIPVWDAIGAVARGKDVVVVGDSKQLPPTTFFQRMEGEEDDAPDAEQEDLESILKECNASGVASMRLTWHYRSRHESLIAFSNRHYYADSLHTFPSPARDRSEMGVSMRFVEGAVYDRGGDRTNRREAEQVVQEVVRILTSSPDPGSLGIVTFNMPQQTLIEDLLDAARREYPEIERHFSGDIDEPVFVKNLETVQGDERDIMIFSICYGPDQQGKVSMNFGPLNQEGGERRLNVAVTRAKERLIVFSSLRGEHIDLARVGSTGALGPAHLRTFLDYAERGPAAIGSAPAAGGAARGDFETTVKRELEARGWRVDAAIGCGGYRIDLGVQDPDDPSRYILGIECDGASYRSAPTARDRERTRRALLTSLGWRLHRVWVVHWHVNKAQAIAAIEKAIEGAIARAREQSASTPQTQPARNQAPAAEDAPPAPSPRQPTPPHRNVIAQYRAARPDPGEFDDVDAYDSPGLVSAAIARIVEAESPIVPELVTIRVGEWFGVSRLTERFTQMVAATIENALAQGTIVADDDALWSNSVKGEAREAGAVGEHHGVREGYDLCRAPGETDADCRDVDHVPLAERVSAVARVLREQGGMPREDLVRESARLLGFGRVTPRVRERMGEAIDRAALDGRARESAGVVTPLAP